MTRTTLDATSTYYNASPAVRLFRWGLGVLQRLWPALGVRAAYRLFGTPLPSRWLSRPRRFPAGWQHEAWPFENASLTLYRNAGTLAGPVVLLLHGWGGHARQMLALADELSRKGMRTVLLEMPAHGRSGGRVSNLPQFARALEYAAARLLSEGHCLHAVLAHSLAANASAYAASRGLPAGRLVLLAPPAFPLEYTRLFAAVFRLSEKTRAAMQRRIEAREGILMTQFEPAAVGPRITMPTLIVHDRGDSINRFSDGVVYRQSIPHARLLATDGLGHGRILADPHVLEQVASFLS